jgi:predicted alpha/beta-fold hydrolase
MRDGGFVTLDWLADQDGAPSDAPLLLLLSGIAGGSGDAYVQHMAADAAALGFRPVCFNSRGCAGGPVTVPQFYSASFTSDLREVVALLAGRHAAAPRLALGWSLGANILVNYLGEEGAAKGPRQQLLHAAVSMGNPHDLQACDAAMERGMGRVYSRSMGKGLRKIFTPHAHLFDASTPVDAAAALRCSTVRGFDDAVTRRSFGFASVDDYYAQSGSASKLPRVRIPLLCLQAADDPIAVDAAVPRAAIAANPHVALVVSCAGGHLGWVEAAGSPLGAPWPNKGVLQWLQARAGELKTGGEAAAEPLAAAA